MGFHGCLAYAVSYCLSKAGAAQNLNNFVASFAVSFSAGVISRFTGRQSVGNTAAGMYALVPGAYLVTSLYTGTIEGGFLLEIIERSVVLGIGAWSGSVVCSVRIMAQHCRVENTTHAYVLTSNRFNGGQPALLGTTLGMVAHHRHHQSDRSNRERLAGSTMLYF
jgi:uncharacterized membrane protein YjjB (DUF3815 family)